MDAGVELAHDLAGEVVGQLAEDRPPLLVGAGQHAAAQPVEPGQARPARVAPVLLEPLLLVVQRVGDRPLEGRPARVERAGHDPGHDLLDCPLPVLAAHGATLYPGIVPSPRLPRSTPEPR